MTIWKFISQAGLLAMLSLGAGSAFAADLKFEHILNIGSVGDGEGQFNY